MNVLIYLQKKISLVIYTIEIKTELKTMRPKTEKDMRYLNAMQFNIIF